MEAVNVKQLQFEMTVVEQSVTVVRSREFMAVYEDYCEEVKSYGGGLPKVSISQGTITCW